MVSPQETVWAGYKKINRSGSPSERRYGRVMEKKITKKLEEMVMKMKKKR